MSVRRRRKKGETTEETRTTERKKKEKCKLVVFGRISDFNIYRGNLTLNV